MKKRLGSRSSGGFLFVERPFFDVDVELTVPNVSMNPSLEDIQGAINSTAKKVLKVVLLTYCPPRHVTPVLSLCLQSNDIL
jgi:dynein heavy chain